MTAETCGTCRFFQSVPPGTAVSLRRPSSRLPFSGVGRCRRFPPAPVHRDQTFPNSEWPQVTSSDWCGEHVIHPEQGLPT